MAGALLLYKLTRLVSLQGPPMLIFSLLLFVHATLSSFTVKAQQRPFSGLYLHQFTTRPKARQTLLTAGDFFFARLVPALGQWVRQ
jgi:hypothetical protein